MSGVIGSKLAAALVKCQSMVEGAKKKSVNGGFRSKYADLGAVFDACSEALSASGLAVLQFPTVSPPGTVGLRTVLVHESGESIEDTFHMPLKDATNPQAAGSALTYARRYSLMAALGIAPEDDDGNAAAKPAAASKPALAPLPVAAPVNLEDLKKGFQEAFQAAAKAKDLAKMKAIYTEVRNSPLTDTASMLAEFGDAIKKGSK